MVENTEGVTDDGEAASIPSGLFTCEPIGGYQVPMIKAGGNLVYLPSAYAFHPGMQAQSSPGSSRLTQKHEGAARVFVVDTGWVNEIPAGRSGNPDYDIDPLTTDIVHGHGEAVLNVIKQLTGSAGNDSEVDLQLWQVRYFESDITDSNKQQFIPIFRDPKPGSNGTVRGFESSALLATLDALSNEVEDFGRPGDILNLSLGAVADRESAEADPVTQWVRAMRDETSLKIVAAAGNHGTSDLCWPAAIADGERVLSVGSGTGRAVNQADHFSAFDSADDPWITHWEEGSDVPVLHQGASFTKGGDCNALWSGTSFATPKVAASLVN